MPSSGVAITNHTIRSLEDEALTDHPVVNVAAGGAANSGGCSDVPAQSVDQSSGIGADRNSQSSVSRRSGSGTGPGQSCSTP